MAKEKKKNPRNAALLLDLMHIVIGSVIVVLAVLAFLNPEQNQVLFPLVFWLAAIFNGVNGNMKLRGSSRDRKKKLAGAALCILSCALTLLGILSAWSIWR